MPHNKRLTFTVPLLHQSVYAAEQVLGPGGREYHKRCLTCISCKKAVAPGTFEEHEADPYCKHCYNKNFGPKGYGHGGAMTGEYRDPILDRTHSPFSSPARANSRASFSREREREIAPDSLSRQSNSGAALDRLGSGGPGSPGPASTSASLNGGGRSSIESPMSKYRTSRLQDMEDDARQERDDLPPEPEYRSRPSVPDELRPARTAAPVPSRATKPSTSSGVGGETELQRMVNRINNVQLSEAPDFDDDDGGANHANDTGGTVRGYTAPGLPTRQSHAEHDQQRLSSSPTKAPFPSYSSSPTPSSPISSRPASPTKAPTASYHPSSLARPDSPASSTGTSVSSGAPTPAVGAGYRSNLGILGTAGPDQCRRCGTTVYFAEKVVASGHKWHKRCLRCAHCSKALDSHLVEKDNLPYCKKCYDEQWGVRSQGFVLRPGLH